MIIKYKVKNHKAIKQELINALEESAGKTFGSVQKTDWGMRESKEYMTIFKPLLEEHMRFLLKKIYGPHRKKVVCSLNNIWYQIYTEASRHDWHTHAKCQLANVYFVELPDKKYATQFTDRKNLNVSEGDIVTFPSWYLHRSPLIKSNKRKIVIAFNLDMDNIC